MSAATPRRTTACTKSGGTAKTTVAATEEGPEASLILKADELRFCDMTRSTVIWDHENVVVDDWTPAYVAYKEPVAAD